MNYSLFNWFAEIFKSVNVAKITAMGLFPAMPGIAYFCRFEKDDSKRLQTSLDIPNKLVIKSSQCQMPWEDFEYCCAD